MSDESREFSETTSEKFVNGTWKMLNQDPVLLGILFGIGLFVLGVLMTGLIKLLEIIF